jgi:predicted HTH domain antitoxin
MTVQIEFPDEILLAAREDRATFVRKATIYTLGHLYAQGKISAGFAAQVVGCDRVEMYRLLSEHGFAVIDYPPEEYEAEARAAEEIAAGFRKS